LTRYYACRHSRNWGPRGKQEIAIGTVDVERCCPCELVSGAIQGDGFNGFYEARKLHGRTASYAASQVNRGGRELALPVRVIGVSEGATPFVLIGRWPGLLLIGEDRRPPNAEWAAIVLRG
jgi:hypothetical protein